MIRTRVRAARTATTTTAAGPATAHHARVATISTTHPAAYAHRSRMRRVRVFTYPNVPRGRRVAVYRAAVLLLAGVGRAR